MKIIYTLTVVIAVVVFSVQSTIASSLDQINNEYEYEYDYYNSPSRNGNSQRTLKSSFELDYNLFTDQTSIGGSLVLEGLVFTGEYGSFTNLSTGVKAKTSWSAGFGLNKRIYICKFLYIEGRLGADYSDIKTTYDDGSTSADSDVVTGKWGAFANARAGLKLFSNTCVNFGSKWKFSEFNLTQEYMQNYYYIGISFLF